MLQLQIGSSNAQVVVVDPCPSDYQILAHLVRCDAVHIHYAETVCDALRLADGLQVLLWMINLQLPDFSGFDLVEMLQPIPKGTAVVVIGDQYQPADERRALNLGVAKYLVKPLSAEWWSDFRLRPSPPQRFSLTQDGLVPSREIRVTKP